MKYDAAIIGAGAAGLMCAMVAGGRGKRVLLLEHASEPGQKILISGGGRCNFTNLDTAPDRFLSNNPHFGKSALKRFTQHDFLALVERHGIAWHEKTLGQLFCDGSARQIVSLLLAECAAAHVDLRTGHRVTAITRSDRFRIATDHDEFTSKSLVLATGGLSIPKMGATGFALDIARQFGLRVEKPRAGLVPLTLGAGDLAWSQPLAGVSLDVVATCNARCFREAMLFTHRGLSGPAVLQISSYLQEGESLILNLLPGQDSVAFLLDRKATRPKAELKTVLSEVLPQRLAQALEPIELSKRPMADLRNADLHRLAELLRHWTLLPTGSEGYAKAEVMAGGIDTAGLSQRTMEAREVPGLYVIGEAMDVTGWLGGYNFQWAWSTGWCAGMAME